MLIIIIINNNKHNIINIKFIINRRHKYRDNNVVYNIIRIIIMLTVNCVINVYDNCDRFIVFRVVKNYFYELA